MKEIHFMAFGGITEISYSNDEIASILAHDIVNNPEKYDRITRVDITDNNKRLRVNHIDDKIVLTIG